MADNSLISSLYQDLTLILKQAVEARLIRTFYRVENQFQTIYASVTNQIQKVAQNHAPARSNADIIYFLQTTKDAIDKGLYDIGVKFQEYYNVLANYDSYRNLIATSKSNMYTNVRTSLSANLESCSGPQNLNYTISTILSFINFLSCLPYFDLSITQVSANLDIQLITMEAALNIYNIKFIPCRPNTLSDAESIACVLNVVITFSKI
jgi:hypothetical protein